MQVRIGSGRTLDAEFSVERHDGRLSLVLESAGGADGNRPARNPDYRDALGVLLGRLQDLDATLVDAVVDSRYTQRMGIPAADRRLIDGPIRLADLDNVTLLRGQL